MLHVVESRPVQTVGMEGFATPEEAAFDPSIPARFRRVLGVKIDGDHAVVYSLTNDRPPFEEYSDYCRLEPSGWVSTHGSGGWDSPPADVVEAARSLGHDY